MKVLIRAFFWIPSYNKHTKKTGSCYILEISLGNTTFCLLQNICITGDNALFANENTFQDEAEEILNSFLNKKLQASSVEIVYTDVYSKTGNLHLRKNAKRHRCVTLLRGRGSPTNLNYRINQRFFYHTSKSGLQSLLLVHVNFYHLKCVCTVLSRNIHIGKVEQAVAYGPTT